MNSVSRATWFRDVQWPGPTEFIPVVGGQTLWEATLGESGPLFVVEQPNYFGRFELRVPTGDNVVTVRRWGTLDGNSDLLVTEIHTEVGSSDTAKNLAGRLSQLPGVMLPPVAMTLRRSTPLSSNCLHASRTSLSLSTSSPKK